MQEFLERYPGNSSEIERFPAVDGMEVVLTKNFSEVDELIYSKMFPHLKKMPGIMGCWSSHLMLWENLLVDEDNDFYVIFEDDAFFTEGFEDKLKNVMDQVTHDMDIVYFGGRHLENFYPRDFNVNWKPVSNFYKYTGSRLGADVDRTTHGYIVTKGGARKLSSTVRTQELNLNAVDGWLNEKRFWLNLLDYFPHLTWSPPRYKSDIQNSILR